MSASSEVSDTPIGETTTSPEATGSFSNFASIMSEAETGDQPVQVAQVQDTDPNPDAVTPAEEIPAIPQPAAQNKPQARDYSGLEPDEIRLFKAMSNEAFSKLLPIYKASKNPPENTELKTLKEQLEAANKSRWYDHEQAYTLSPDYANVKSNLDDLSFEENYWQQQLAAAEDGKPVQFLVKKNDDGTYLTGEEQPPTPQVKAQLIAAMTRASQYKTTVSEKLQSLQASYKNNWKSYHSNLEAVDKAAFNSLDMNHPGVKTEYNNWLNKFPAETRGQLQTQMLAKSMVVIQGLIQQLNQKNVTGQVNTAVNRTAKATGPGSATRIASSTPSTQDEDAKWKNLLGGKNFF